MLLVFSSGDTKLTTSAFVAQTNPEASKLDICNVKDYKIRCIVGLDGSMDI